MFDMSMIDAKCIGKLRYAFQYLNGYSNCGEGQGLRRTFRRILVMLAHGRFAPYLSNGYRTNSKLELTLCVTAILPPW